MMVWGHFAVLRQISDRRHPCVPDIYERGIRPAAGESSSRTRSLTGSNPENSRPQHEGSLWQRLNERRRGSSIGHLLIGTVYFDSIPSVNKTDYSLYTASCYMTGDITNYFTKTIYNAAWRGSSLLDIVHTDYVRRERLNATP